MQINVSYYPKELINFCNISGFYPFVYKFAQVTPIHEKGSLRNISNYRQVSVLSKLNKVFENLIYNRFRSFCQTSKFLAKNQFGFRKKRHTELVALILIDKLIPSLEQKQYAICVFFSITLLASAHSLVQYFMIN